MKNTNITWVDPIVPDEEDRVAYLKYKHTNGQLYRRYDILTGTVPTTSYLFQEDPSIDPIVGDEALRCRVIDLGSDNQQTLYDIVTLTQEIIDFTDPIDNLAPTDIALTNNTIANNTPIGGVVGTLSTYDPNIGDTHTYTIVDDPDDKFDITGNTLRTTALMTAHAHSHFVTIRSTDQGGLFFDKQFTVFVQAAVGFDNEKATIFQGDTVEMDMLGPAANAVLPSNGSFTVSTWIKKDNPIFQNNYSLAFSTNERVDTTVDLSSKTAVTISGWFYRATSAQRLDISQSNAGNSQRIKLVVNSNGSLYAVLGAINIQYIDAPSGWFHLAMTFDGSQPNADRLKLYRDGVELTGTSTPTVPTAIQSIPDLLTIGFDRGANAYSDGKIDEVSIWDKALSLSEVQSIYNNQKPNNLLNHSANVDLLNWWRMGDLLAAPTVPDQKGTDDGTLVNMDATNRSTALDGDGQGVSTPDDISGLDLWLDADDAATITQSGGLISQWNDKSGNNNNMTQSSGTNQPVVVNDGYGNRNTISFNNPQYLESTYAVNNNATIFTVFYHNHGASQPAGPVWQLNNTLSTNGFYPRWVDGNQYVGIAGSSWMSKATTLNNNQFYTTAVVYDDDNTLTQLYVDGVLNDSNASVEDETGSFTIGRRLNDSANFLGEVAEVLIYNRTLTPLERQEVEEYLIGKWENGLDVRTDKTVMDFGTFSLTYNQADKFKFKYIEGGIPKELVAQDSNYSNNEYNNVVMMYNSIAQNVMLHVNGPIVSQVSGILPARDNTSIRIAGDSYQNKFLDATVDEVSVYSSTASATELYNEGFAQDLLANGNLPSPRLWLRMGDQPDNYLIVNGIGDRSGNEHHFTANNMSNSNAISDAVLTAPVYANEKSLPFNGIDQYGDTGITTDLTGSGDFSISVWYKGTTPSYIVSQAHQLTPSYSSDWIIGGGGAVFWMRTQTVGNLASISDNQWHHLVMSWNSTANTYDGYVDGVNIGTSATVSGFGGAGTVSVSTRGDFTSSFNQGNVDEIGIFNKALDDTEVTEIYNAGVPNDLTEHSAEVNLTNYYRMGEDTGDDDTTVVDQKGTNDITLSNFLPNPYSTDVPT